MKKQSGLGSLVGVTKRPRLSVREIHAQWNNELHAASGYTRYKIDPSLLKENQSESPTDKLMSVVGEMKKSGKWCNENGQLADDEPIERFLFEFALSGKISIYSEPDLTAAPYSVKEKTLNQLVIKSAEFFIDKEELGCFLLKNGKNLPKFWFSSEDETVLKDRVTRGESEAYDKDKQIVKLVEEVEWLKRQLFDVMPFMNPGHHCYSKELEAAVSLWMYCFADKKEGDLLGQLPTLANWLKQNRIDAISQDNGEISENAIKRVTRLVNPNKKGGRLSAD